MLKIVQSIKLIMSSRVRAVLALTGYILLLAFVGYRSYYAYTVNSAAFDKPLYFLFNYSYFYFLLVLFFTYDVFLQIKLQLFEEVIQAGRKNGMRSFFQAVCLIHIIMAAGIIIYIAAAALLYEGWRGEFILYQLKASCLYILLNGFIAVFAAAAAAKIRNKFWGMGVLAVIVIVTCPLLKGMMTGFKAGNPIRRAWELFDIIPYSGNLEVPVLYEFSISDFRWLRAGIWLCICGFICLYVYKIYRKKILKRLSVIAVLAAALGTYGFYQPHSVWGDIGSDRITLDYYMENNSKADNYADFAVMEYDMDIHIGNGLKVTCGMKLDETGLDEYVFNLYHTFKVLDVRDQNNEKLEYDRQDDCVFVHALSGSTDEIVIMYKGCPDNFYADREAVYLSGMFPYYPKAGNFSVYNLDNQNFQVLQDNSGTYYHVKLSGNTDVVTNLEEVSENEYEGYSNGVTLFGGFITSITVEGIEVYYPYLSRDTINKENCAAIFHQIEDTQKGFLEEMRGGKIFVTGLASSGQYCTVFEGYIECTFLNSLRHGFYVK